MDPPLCVCGGGEGRTGMMRTMRGSRPSALLPSRAQNRRSPRVLQQPSSCGLLHIPHILYAQLRRNNQGSNQGHSRAAIPHAGGFTCAETASLGQARPDLGLRGLEGIRKASSEDKGISLCSTETKELEGRREGGWDQERKKR